MHAHKHGHRTDSNRGVTRLLRSADGTLMWSHLSLWSEHWLAASRQSTAGDWLGCLYGNGSPTDVSRCRAINLLSSHARGPRFFLSFLHRHAQRLCTPDNNNYPRPSHGRHRRRAHTQYFNISERARHAYCSASKTLWLCGATRLRGTQEHVLLYTIHGRGE